MTLVRCECTTDHADPHTTTETLRRAHHHANTAATQLQQAIRQARTDGHRWADIAALDIPALLAQQRYGTGEEREQAHELRQARKARRRLAVNTKPPTPDQ